MNTKKILNAFAAVVLTLAATAAAPARAAAGEGGAARTAPSTSTAVREPLNLAVLVQDDLVSRVGSELSVTRDFVKGLPAGSRVMVGYLTSGALQVRQPFTDNLDAAARSLRMPVANESASPYNPYVEVGEALKKFDRQSKNRNVVLLVSDGLDVSRGFDPSSTIDSVDLQRAAREAKDRNVAIYSFYAPSVGLTSYNRLATSYGQSALERLTRATGGRAFFQGYDFVTFDAYFAQLGRALNGDVAY